MGSYADALLAAAPWALAAAITLGGATTLFALAAFRQARVEAERGNPWAERAEGLADRALSAVASAFSGTGTKLTGEQLATVWACCAALPPAACLAAGLGAGRAALSCAVGAALPALWARTARRRARLRFEETLGHALPLVASNLRGGLSFSAALVPVGESMSEPLRGEFARLGADIDSGTPMEEALARMAARNDSKDVALLASAVMAQRETGGNLADVIDSVAVAVRNRCELRQMVRGKTSQARMSAKLLAALPVLLVGAMCMLSESFREYYLSAGGLVTLAAMAAMVGGGYVVMVRMADMRAD